MARKMCLTGLLSVGKVCCKSFLPAPSCHRDGWQGVESSAIVSDDTTKKRSRHFMATSLLTDDFRAGAAFISANRELCIFVGR